MIYFFPTIFFSRLRKNQLIRLLCSIFAQILNEAWSSLILPQKRCLLKRYLVFRDHKNWTAKKRVLMLVFQPTQGHDK